MNAELTFPNVFALDISEMSEEELKIAYSFSDHSRQEKIKALNRLEDKKRCAGAGLLLYWFLSDIKDGAVGIAYEKTGKPCLINSSMYLSITHSGKWVAVTFSHMPIGLDIEEVKFVKPGVYPHCTVKSESDALINLPMPKRTSEFIRLWTLKESYVKMTGQGLYDRLNEIEVINNGEYYCIERLSVKEDVFLLNTEFDNNYQLSVCLKVRAGEIPDMKEIIIHRFKPENIISGCNMYV